MKKTSSPRPYRQSARADSAKATTDRIIAAFVSRLSKHWYDEITLDDVAKDADTTVQTIIRHFGGKAELLTEAIREMMKNAGTRRAAPPGDVDRLARNLVDDYEQTGDTIIRLLAVEGRHAGLHELLSHARSRHREWISRQFAGHLELLDSKSRTSALDALVIATDTYTWKLLRRDMQRSVNATRTAIINMIRSTLAASHSRLHGKND